MVTLAEYLASDPIPEPVVECEAWGIPTGVRVGRTDLKYRVLERKSEPARAKGILRAFLKLGAGGRVVDFVDRYGPLWVCKHGLPRGHARTLTGKVPQSCGPLGCEAVRWYSDYPRVLGASLRTWDRLRHGHAVSTPRRLIGRGEPFPEDLDTLNGFWTEQRDAASKFYRRYRRHRSRLEVLPSADQEDAGRLTLEVVNWWLAVGETDPGRLAVSVANWWITAGGVRQTLEVPLASRDSLPRPSIRWTGGAWSAIGAQLAVTFLAESATASCAGCGKSVSRARRPQSGRQAWCDASACRALRDREKMARSRARARAEARD
jgi:hypothetical protein